jgi:hypothetical protein
VEPANLGFCDRPLDLARLEDGREVEQGAGHGGDGNPSFDCDLVFRQPHVVEPSRFAGPYATRRRHLDEGALGSPETPEPSGGPVTEHRPGAASQHGRDPLALDRGRSVADGIDAPIQRVEATALDPVPDRTRPEPES